MDIKGDWNIFYCNATRRAIGVISEDFEHDVVLRVDGDFESDEQQKEYCEALAKKLNNN